MVVVRINAALQQAPAQTQAEAEAVAVMAKNMVDEAAKEQPNKTLVQISAAGLKQAAQNIESVLPAVLPIAMKIAEVVGKMIA